MVRFGVPRNGKIQFAGTCWRTLLKEGCDDPRPVWVKTDGPLSLRWLGDGEGLAWLRSPYAKDKKILLTHGENVSVKKSPCDTKPVSKVRLRDFEDYDIIISASPLYSGIDNEFVEAAHLTDKLWVRRRWKRLTYCIIREAANMIYSRLKLTDNQVVAKSQMTYLVREARHCGLSLGLDSVRYFSIDIDIRSLSDFMLFKSQGMYGFTKDLRWMYSWFKPSKVRNMPPSCFLVLTRGGSIGLGHFPYPKWHKEEREDIMKAVGVDVEYGEPVKEGEYRGTFQTVSDMEHSEMIRLYVEENLGYVKIAEKLGRSTRTVHVHVHKHNEAVERNGYCMACRRVKSLLESRIAQRSPY